MFVTRLKLGYSPASQQGLFRSVVAPMSDAEIHAAIQQALDQVEGEHTMRSLFASARRRLPR
jgi:hypothetical protein